MRGFLALALALAATPAAARPVTVAVAPGVSYVYEGTRWTRSEDHTASGRTVLSRVTRPAPEYPTGQTATLAVRPHGTGTPSQRIERALSTWEEGWPRPKLTGPVVQMGGLWRAPFSSGGDGAFEEGTFALAETGGRDVIVVVSEAYRSPTDKVVTEALAGLRVR